ncbi:MAG TPA: S66 peptidase family protein [Candidatus Dormibacteraeota bacterium]|nr:S66 peptidase family protein [Candidatus Dormibacteraeota bacterium]
MGGRPPFVYPAKPAPGDRVAVLSPSWAGPAVHPAVFERGLRRLRSEFELVPVEYPTTRQLDASPAERARDIHAAFTDPSVRAVLTSIGGEDQLRVLRHLDARVLRAHPKPFFGYSDSTNLLIYLWNLGLVAYHGGSVMVEFGRAAGMHPLTAASLRAALFSSGPETLTPPPEFTDQEADWSEAATAGEPALEPSGGWSWHGPPITVSGPAWGGSLEIVDFHLRSGRHLLEPEAYAGAVLLLETSEETPPATYVYRVLMGMGERGMLEQFAAVLVGRPKAWSFERRRSAEERQRYIGEQRTAVLRALQEYTPSVPVVCGVDFGHTDPQLVIPTGGTVVVDGARRQLQVTY